jgi:hypothetical protein
MKSIDEHPDIVHFRVVDLALNYKQRDIVVFKLGYETIRELREALNHEIVKYVFHPLRVQRFSEKFELGELGYLEVI